MAAILRQQDTVVEMIVGRPINYADRPPDSPGELHVESSCYFLFHFWVTCTCVTKSIAGSFSCPIIDSDAGRGLCRSAVPDSLVVVAPSPATKNVSFYMPFPDEPLELRPLTSAELLPSSHPFVRIAAISSLFISQ